MNVLDLFSGIGGFSLGLERAGMRTVAFCELDSGARSILAKHWPGIPCYADIRELTAARLAADGIVADVISGGFPCQDISCASPTRHLGIDGERSGLWSELARLVGEVRPRYAILENSSALAGRGLGRVLGDLAEIGYDAEWHCLRASDVGAPFEGDRIYLLATPHPLDGQERLGLRPQCLRPGTLQRACAEYRSTVWLEATCRSARMGDGFSDFMDRRRRTEWLGNAVVPQIPEIIGRAIMTCHSFNAEGSNP